MSKKIIAAVCVIVILISAAFAGNAFLNFSKSNTEQNVVLMHKQDLNNVVKETISTEDEIAYDEKQKSDKSLAEEVIVDSSSVDENIDEIEEKIEAAQENGSKPDEGVVSEKTVISDKRLTCTLSVNCFTVLENIHKLKEDKKELIPNDGIILKEIEVEFFPDESVFDVLHRELKNNNIHFEFVKTPAYNSVYIEGIANLYEFDCGELSGWLYKVNGVKPTYGCSQYKLENNDKIEFFYSCNLFE